MLHIAETNHRTNHLPPISKMGRGEAKNKRKGNKGAEGGGEEKKTPSTNADNNAAPPPTKNPFANLLCDLSPYNLPQLRDAEAKYYERIEIAKVEPGFLLFSTNSCSRGVLAADLLSTAVDVACVH